MQTNMRVLQYCADHLKVALKLNDYEYRSPIGMGKHEVGYQWLRV
jgi:hypothetical protein